MGTRRLRPVSIGLAILLFIASAVPALGATATSGGRWTQATGDATAVGWSHIGTGPHAATTATSQAVWYPAGIAAGDLLLLGCQGRRNAMSWSAPGFSTISSHDYAFPAGPPGLRFDLRYRWADGGESGTAVTVHASTGINGWSCAITAMRGGAGHGLVVYHDANRIDVHADTRARMTATRWNINVGDFLVTQWFVSSDDNSHGLPSEGRLAFGGTAYDTTVGTDHATSMAWQVGENPCWPPEECPPPGPDDVAMTMQQRANAPDSYVAATVVFANFEVEPAVSVP